MKDDAIYRFLRRLISDQDDLDEYGEFTAAGWDRMCRVAEAEGVAPLVYWKSQQLGWPTGSPQSFHNCLTNAYYNASGRNILIFRELGRVLSALDQAAISVVLLKGAALATTVYPDIALRPMGDLDLLIPQQRALDAAKVLRGLGYQVELVTTYHIVMRSHDSRDIVVELHWNLVRSEISQSASDLEWYLNKREPWRPRNDILGLGVRTHYTTDQVFQFAPVAHLFYLAAHLVLQHRPEEERLLWLYDIHLLVSERIKEGDFQELSSQARKMGLGWALRTVLVKSQDIFSTPIPESVVESLEDCVQEVAYSDNDQMDAIGWDLVRALDWRTRWNLIWRMLFPTPERILRRYQPQPKWIWLAYYPYRWWQLVIKGIRVRNT